MTGANPAGEQRPPVFFVGEHLALDFLNTVATPATTPVDWLTNGNDLLDWLKQAAALDPLSVKKIRGFGPKAIDEVAQHAREFRQWLRGFVTARMEKPLRVTAAALGPLNKLLAAENSFQQLHVPSGEDEDGRQLQLRRVPRWESPAELLQPIADAAADLICHCDFRLIRGCEGSNCTLLFLDRTKAHSRRWCSMAVCGNRAKVAAHRAKKGNA
jgi:predicted RNA-binding Zn ribbon-like protein